MTYGERLRRFDLLVIPEPRVARLRNLL